MFSDNYLRKMKKTNSCVFMLIFGDMLMYNCSETIFSFMAYSVLYNDIEYYENNFYFVHNSNCYKETLEPIKIIWLKLFFISF